MKVFIILICLYSLTSEARGAGLVLFGGGSRPALAMKHFVKLAGGKEAKIMVIPWASSSTAGGMAVRSELLSSGAGLVDVAPLLPFSARDEMSLKNQLQKSTGIFFSGGDQNRLMETIKFLGLTEQFRNQFKSGVAFAGTSAGTAIMSRYMLTGEGDLSVINGDRIGRAEGLGLLPDRVLVDQHFVVRSRFNRLAGVILRTGEFGIGVDENTALVFSHREATVIGPTQVLFFRRLSPKKLEVEILSHGDKKLF